MVGQPPVLLGHTGCSEVQHWAPAVISGAFVGANAALQSGSSTSSYWVDTCVLTAPPVFAGPASTGPLRSYRNGSRRGRDSDHLPVTVVHPTAEGNHQRQI